jgi:hypothetical protein
MIWRLLNQIPFFSPERKNPAFCVKSLPRTTTVAMSNLHYSLRGKKTREQEPAFLIQLELE